jgi:hypothetical protein
MYVPPTITAYLEQCEWLERAAVRYSVGILACWLIRSWKK